MNILFFGSTGDSKLVVNKLSSKHNICAVVTQPPKPVGRKKIITPTPVEVWASEKGIPIYTFSQSEEKAWFFEDEKMVSDNLSKLSYDIVISASFGQKIPKKVITAAKFGAYNIHPSNLPRFRGADPVPWTIISGDKKIGVTIITLEDSFDTGKILAQQSYSIDKSLCPDEIRTQLFSKGVENLLVLLDMPHKLDKSLKTQDFQKATYACRLNREDGYIKWETIANAKAGKSTTQELKNITIFNKLLKYDPGNTTYETTSDFINTLTYALYPWPGVWTLVKINSHDGQSKEIRMKLLETKITADNKLELIKVQFEGKNPTNFKNISNKII